MPVHLKRLPKGAKVSKSERAPRVRDPATVDAELRNEGDDSSTNRGCPFCRKIGAGLMALMQHGEFRGQLMHVQCRDRWYTEHPEHVNTMPPLSP